MRPTLILSLALTAAAYGQPAVNLPAGQTNLGELGLYRLVWQSYGGPEHEMPEGWAGGMNDESGIAYNPNDSVLGRSAIFLHSPWRVPAGRTYVEYRLRFPNVTPITLALGHTMNEFAAQADRSDGVTFTAVLVANGQETELLGEHYDKAAWRDLTVDLSRLAGQEAVLRLQVEPGPANNSSFDFSYWSAVVACGSDPTPDDLGRRAAALASRRAYQAVAGRSLLALANRPGAEQGIIPSTFFAPSNSVTEREGAYVFISRADDATVTYTWRPSGGTLDELTAKVDDGPELRLASGGGVTFAVGDHTVRGTGGRAEAVRTHPARAEVSLDWRYPDEQGGAVVTWTLSLAGRALRVRAACQQPVVGALSLGRLAGVDQRRSVAVPYLAGALTYLPTHSLYANSYLDWTASHASRCPGGEATYDPLTDGSRNTLLEDGFITLTPHLVEALPNLPSPASPYLAELGPKIMLDIWGHQPGGYAADGELLRRLKDNGVDHLAIIQHVWQCYGYDVKLPDHLPANAAFGGDEGMAAFGQAARDCGYLWSLHENYIDLYPDAPSYDPAARVLQADGSPSPAWYNEGTKVQSFGLKVNRALGYAEKVAPEAHRRYGTNAAYLDVHTCVPPWHQLDHEAGQPQAGMALAKVKLDTELFDYMRSSHGGPLFGEGANHFYWAGRCDGVEAQVAGGENHRPLLDFDLLRLHPQMVNHGMGYYERWFSAGYDSRLGENIGSATDFDRYRAQEVAYGHAGFIGNALTGNVNFVAKEHHLMHAVQALANTAKVEAIDYLVGDRYVTASVAVALGVTSRQRIRYDSGLTVWVNWAPEPWAVDGQVLPQWGWWASGGGTQAGTLERDGKVVDVVTTPEYTYLDARTWFAGNDYLSGRLNIAPTLEGFRDLGDGQMELTYQWKVDQAPMADYNCFVHFTHEGQSAFGGDDIIFQHDHGLPRPTSAWQAGDIITDGPHIVTVPEVKVDTVDITIGLFNASGRQPLVGVRAPGERILIGRLKFTREGDKVTGIELVPVSAADDTLPARPDFTERVNPAGTSVEQDAVRTDGSVKVVASGERERTVWPYPRERAFTVALRLPTTAAAGAAKVTALAAETAAPMGAVPATAEGDWLTFTVGSDGVGRYTVSW